MKIRLLLVATMFAGLSVMIGCGKNVAPAGSTITVNPTSITWSSGIPYVTSQIYTTLSDQNGKPMNNLQVDYYAPLAVGSFPTASTGFYAFYKNNKVCNSPCVDTTNSSGMSNMNIIFCTTSDCSSVVPVQLPYSWTTTTLLTYTDTVTVSSGGAAPVNVAIKIN